MTTPRPFACSRGHEWTEESTFYQKDGRRQCLTCRSDPRARPTTCRSGHEYTEENTRIRADGSRACRACRKASRPKKTGPRWDHRQKGFSDCDAFPPACKCGCGEPVPQAFNSAPALEAHGLPWKGYVNRAHQEWDFSEKAARRGRMRITKGVPAQEFGQTLMDLKIKNGWTWLEMGILTGRRHTSLHQYTYLPKGNVSHEVAADILARLAGKAKLPTKRQAQEYTATRTKMSKDDRAETMRENSLNERRDKVSSLRERLGHG